MMETQQDATSRTRPGVGIVYRRPDFGDFEGLPKYWVGGNPPASFMIGVFSLVIPEGALLELSHLVFHRTNRQRHQLDLI